jgi:hypothetical protein
MPIIRAMAATLSGFDLSRPIRVELPGRTLEGELRAVNHGRKLVVAGTKATLTIALPGGSVAVESVDGATMVELDDASDGTRA